MGHPETTTHTHTAQHVRDLVLGGADEDVIERLALAAVEAIERERAAREVLAEAVDRLHLQAEQIDRLREEVRRLRDELRRAAADRREAA